MISFIANLITKIATLIFLGMVLDVVYETTRGTPFIKTLSVRLVIDFLWGIYTYTINRLYKISSSIPAVKTYLGKLNAENEARIEAKEERLRKEADIKREMEAKKRREFQEKLQSLGSMYEASPSTLKEVFREKEHKELWNAWQKERLGEDIASGSIPLIDMRWVDGTLEASEKDLSFTDLRSKQCIGCVDNAVLAGADLSELRSNEGLYKNCDFRYANLTGIRLSEARFLSCAFDGTRLKGASFKKSQFMDCEFNHVDFESVNLEESRFTSYGHSIFRFCTFSDINLRRVNFENESKFENVHFIRCEMTDVQYAGLLDKGCEFHDSRVVR